jgi:hypothetical protein
MAKPQRKAIADFRRRLEQRGMARLELRVRKDDVDLVRDVVRALTSPELEQETRALLREHFQAGDAKGLKALLAEAPLDGLDLTRTRDTGRNVDL